MLLLIISGGVCEVGNKPYDVDEAKMGAVVATTLSPGGKVIDDGDDVYGDAVAAAVVLILQLSLLLVLAVAKFVTVFQDQPAPRVWYRDIGSNHLVGLATEEMGLQVECIRILKYTLSDKRILK
ncbi:hypothetical protein GQX74_002434 [Glossina fuscipes]|nr:hypothetical protein GQX74_002434 [Glossina fuscipes]